MRLAWQADRCSIGVQGGRALETGKVNTTTYWGARQGRRVKWGTLATSTRYTSTRYTQQGYKVKGTNSKTRQAGMGKARNTTTSQVHLQQSYTGTSGSI